MGFDLGAPPLAATATEIDSVLARMRQDLMRANMTWLTTQVTKLFPGNSWLVLRGENDRESVLVRQVAIYLGNTLLSLPEIDCARAFGVGRQSATRAVQRVEERRETDIGFRAKLEILEAWIAQRNAVRSEAA